MDHEALPLLQDKIKGKGKH